jgi:hypothetical protein
MAKQTPTLTLAEAVDFIILNDDLNVPGGVRPLSYLSGVVSVAVVAAVYGKPSHHVAALVWRRVRPVR